MNSAPVIHRKQRRVVVVADVQPPAAPAVAEPKTHRLVLKLKAKPQAASAPESATGTAATTKPAKPVQEPLSAAERRRRLAAKVAAALAVLAEHYPALFTSSRPMAIGTSKVLDAEHKAGHLPLGCIPGIAPVLRNEYGTPARTSDPVTGHVGQAAQISRAMPCRAGQASEQYFTSSQLLAQRRRHVIGGPQGLLGKAALLPR